MVKVNDLKSKGIIQDIKELKGKSSIKQRVISRKVLKPNQMQVRIQNRPVESNWGSSSSFFKQELEEANKSFFFS
jgi:hypothetical protein